MRRSWIAAGASLVVAWSGSCGDAAGPERDSQGAVVAAGALDVAELVVGDCVLAPPGSVPDGAADAEVAEVAEVVEVDVVPCPEAHDREVLALLEVAGDDFPGVEALNERASAGCVERFAPYVGVPFVESELFVTSLIPSPSSWADGDRTITCFVTTDGEPLLGSVAGSRR